MKAPVASFCLLKMVRARASRSFVDHSGGKVPASFCTEVRQLSKYRAAELCLALCVQHSKFRQLIALLDCKSVNPASGNEIA
jgi:hypothetical protein